MALIHTEIQGIIQQPATRIQPVEVPFLEGTVAQLIKGAVEAQVRDLTVRRQWTAGAVRQALDVQYQAHLPETFMRQLLAWQKINIRHEVQAALHSFQQGIFAICVDGRELPRHLEESVRLSQDSRVLFRRVCPVLVAQCRRNTRPGRYVWRPYERWEAEKPAAKACFWQTGDLICGQAL